MQSLVFGHNPALSYNVYIFSCRFIWIRILWIFRFLWFVDLECRHRASFQIRIRWNEVFPWKNNRIKKVSVKLAWFCCNFFRFSMIFWKIICTQSTQNLIKIWQLMFLLHIANKKTCFQEQNACSFLQEGRKGFKVWGGPTGRLQGTSRGA